MRIDVLRERLMSGEENPWLVYELCKQLREERGQAFLSLGHVEKVRELEKLLPDVPAHIISEGYAEFAASAWATLPIDADWVGNVEEAG